MSMPTPGDFAHTEKTRSLISSDGPCGDTPLDDALNILVQAGSSFGMGEVDADVVLEAAGFLHEGIQTRLEEAR